MLKRVEFEVSTGNPKCTYLDIRCVNRAKISEFNGKRYLWPNGNGYKNIVHDGSSKHGGDGKIVVETDSPFLYVNYQTGSWKNTYESFTGLYDVENERWILKLGNTNKVGEEVYKELKKQMIEEGFALSNSKPITNVIGFYLYKNATNEEERKLEKAKNMIKEIVDMIGKEKALEILNSL